MQPKKYAKLASKGVKTLGLALASSCLIYSGADAAGLGKLTVLSSLGQPLRAEIELTSVTKDDIGNLVPKLASFDAFRQANVEYSHNLMSLRFAIEDRGSRHYVLITSTQSINEPFLGVLVELNSTNGKLVREYTMLLDPVELRTSNPVSTSTSAGNNTAVTKSPDVNSTVTTTALPPTTPASSSASSTTTIPTNTPTKLTSKEVANNRSDANERKNDSLDYKIKSGDTLRKIAIQFKHPGVSLDQMLVALQRSNTSSVINGNMNLIRKGSILTIPGKAEASNISQSEAKKIVIAQSVDFNNYRNKLANQVTEAKAEKSVETNKTEGGKITAKVIESPTPVNESKDKLKLSKAQLQEKQVQEENKIAKQKALEEANARVKELEKNTADLQKILELQNKTVSGSTASQASATNPTPAKNTEAVGASSTSSSTGSSNSATLSTVDATISASLPLHKLKKPPVVEQTPAQTTGFLDNWVSYLPYGAAILALLGLAGIYSSKKRKKNAEQLGDESILTETAGKDNSLFGSSGGQSVDTNNSVFNSNFVPSASLLDANEVDPVAEADVYIAYGRDEQAEEILKEALRTQPDRQAVRIKLLEIYAHRKDLRTFETVASELYGITGGEGPDWAQAASLGIMIDPQNPLYAGGQASEHTAALGASTLPVENLGVETTQENLISHDNSDSVSTEPDSSHSDKTDLSNDGLDFDLGLTKTENTKSDFEFESSFEHNLSKNDELVDDHLGHESKTNDQIDVKNISNQKTKEVNQTISEAHAIASAHKTNDKDAENGMNFADLDFDLNTKTDELVQIETKTPTIDVPPTLENVSSHNIEQVIPSSFDFDLSGIDLDLTKTATDDHLSNSGVPGSNGKAKIDEVDANLTEESSEEMSTKLDLAVAYQEIGDKDGARELLDEVIKAGSQEQIARAKAIMHELAR